MTKIRQYYQIEDGPLAGTILESIGAFLTVQYPQRKTKDLYVPPMTNDEKKLTYAWRCCQDCPEPDFFGGLQELVEHLKLHAGRLLKRKGK